MKLLRKGLIRHYRTAKGAGEQHIKKRPYLGPLLGVVLGFLIVLVVLTGQNTRTLRPSEGHVVYLFEGSHRQVLDTKEKTVGDLLNKLPSLNLIDQDVIEPARSTPIVEDNFRINVYRARPVTVVDNGNKLVTLTAQRSARVVAQGAGLALHPEDIANFSQGSISENVIGEKVIINRATPILLNLYGGQLTTYTQAKTVGDLLREKQVKLSDGESVQPAQNTPVTANMQVYVLRKDAKVVNLEEAIPAGERVVQDPSLSFGTTVIRQAGAPGKKAVTYLIQSDASGAEISRTIIQEAVIQAPVPQITARGSTIDISGDKTSVMAAAGISAGDYGFVNYIVSRESNWHVTAQNASGAYGLCQSLPGSKMASAGADWVTNPVTQLRWCSGYASRYGGWSGAYNFWASHHYW
ncbi:G5 domain-containing protein [Candidatus Saccharibacteria bacterium]|nr:G5 domain-containing protein [Candidatus Saccharibacteria bacterium]